MSQQRNKKTKLSVAVPEFFNSKERAELAVRIMDYIKDRTISGQNVYGRNWAGKAGVYTKEYAKKKGFKSPVDLSLKGNMLDAMKYFKSMSPDGIITVGYTKNSTEAKKAEGNILGTYGWETPRKGKARPFLDILKKDVATIVADYIEEKATGKEVE
jgi:hypothetical protein